MKTLKYFLIASLAFFSLSGCGNDSKTPTMVFSGTAKDSETGEAVSGVRVELSSSESQLATTDNSGRYTFDGVKQGKYNLSFTKTGYEYLTAEVSVGVGKTGNSTYNAALKKIPEAPATVTLKEYLAISDGIYYIFSPSSNTKNYYWRSFKTSELPQNEDDIIKKLLSDGVNSDITSIEGYSYDLNEKTDYTICAVAYDSQGKRGPLYRMRITTKSSTNQPEAKITIKSVNNGVVTYDIKRNSLCNKYILSGWLNLTSKGMESPDIVWAADIYFSEDKDTDTYAQDFTSDTWSGWSNNCLMITFGYDKSGNLSGVINKQFFSAGTTKGFEPVTKTADIRTEQDGKCRKADFGFADKLNKNVKN